jgi:predicted NBD/HSP70 family sugar kinase
LAELWFGLGRKLDDFIYVFVDRGVGIGIVVNDQIQEGINGVAGEFGHTTIQLDGRQCYCGNRGCIEMYVSSGAILREIESLGYKLESKPFYEIIDHDDDVEIQTVLKKSARTLAYGISNLINLFNPAAILLGGVVPECSEVFINEIKQYYDERVFSKRALQTPLYISEMYKQHECLGSIALILNEFYHMRS